MKHTWQIELVLGRFYMRYVTPGEHKNRPKNSQKQILESHSSGSSRYVSVALF